MVLPNTVDGLNQKIVDTYESLPKQLKSIANYIIQHGSSVAVDRVSDIAKACEVQNSAIIRFAKNLGFNGFSDMQAIFRKNYTERNAPIQNYQQRIRRLVNTRSTARIATAAEVAQEFIEGCRQGIGELTLNAEDFEIAVMLLHKAETIYTIGVRRSFAAAFYLTYAMQRARKRVILLSGMGGMMEQQISGMRKGDVLIATSFYPYGKETQRCIHLASEKKVDILAITDGCLAPFHRYLKVLLPVKEGTALGFRSLTNTLCLCQALVIALAYKHDHPSFDSDYD